MMKKEVERVRGWELDGVPEALRVRLEGYRKELLRLWDDPVVFGEGKALVSGDYERSRIELRRRASGGLSDRVAEHCRADFSLFVNGFCETYDPRSVRKRVLAFRMYPFQYLVAFRLLQFDGRKDILIEKPRTMGVTWLCCVYLPLWRLLFWPGDSTLLVSRSYDMVERRGDPKALMTKLRFALERMPEGWAKSIEARRGVLSNLDTGSTISGASTTEDVGRGDRRTRIVIDEFGAFRDSDSRMVLAATQHATDCRIFNSTAHGMTGAYYDLVRNAGSLDVARIVLDWWMHPEYGKGLYYADREKVVKIDVTDAVPDGYPVVRDGRLRSPWYDGSEKRCPSKELFRQEVDREFLTGYSGYFDGGMLNEVMVESCRPPAVTGDPVIVAGGVTAVDATPDGRLRLWGLSDVEKVPGHPGRVRVQWRGRRGYTIGCDVALGAAAMRRNYSVLCVLDRDTGEQVAEYVSADISPTDLARLAAALGAWFGGASIIWESNGPVGGLFGAEIERIGYRNVWRGRDRMDRSGPGGIGLSQRGKRELFAEFSLLLKSKRVRPRSGDAVAELFGFVDTQTAIEYRGRGGDGDVESHGDRAMAMVLAAYAADMLSPEAEEAAAGRESEPDDPFTFAGRRRLREAAAVGNRDGWPELETGAGFDV